MIDISLVMLGAGSSTRFGLATKKQWLRTGDTPLWLKATKNISSNYNFKEIIVVSNECEYMSKFDSNIKFIQGGATRQDSLKNALNHINSDYVMVSDIARIDIPQSLIKRLIDDANLADCIVPVLKVSDTAVYGDSYINRDELKRIQTPQLSKTKLLKQALNSDKIYTDDSSAIAATCGKVWYIAGDERARKLTYKDDLKLINLKPPSSDIFCGNGFDVHAFCDGDYLSLGGIKVPFNKAFKAHSDGDVAIHALCDAILGAASAPDIGQLFPDNDMKFKGIDSKILLERSVEFVRSVGFDIVNVDLTIICEQPKISPYKDEMAKILADVMKLSRFRVNIKATTSEKLGFTGRGEGVAVIANANLKYFDWTRL
ncbi:MULTISPECIES: bifunctional 2-C-methyl-D-erythritol 4-phosphate cytidylyltransferase/2-C-methyl-D-erythritol 2,4-cyclodiphosphate synthase [Campylobacter]|uniref:bifunctional 2-C-methyl-D-erythritol 4-phosphate cytidylyltransferase/2-C-methyl-D-erythritol 2,4-cyclodiphosphate synthase n=1 Tax=Campylobacter TaxID=194 RepID=UPI000A32E684|nr:bifunctional 2-C-methyl-D-erythritol 4-phosphate cytidylyltransferase/2-C-methyl-D-erythritol 2,4-cyclodiphosphate synthase [Campylobacter sp. P0024]MCR8678700.1 bifunctional 2-C-methyl-D-erythritol 4-phosphate cytidylyltransferase/2-C-methyl-D-erythritol 2,4-cyclodiphosphate synthase [Campylobacter sp. RM19072]